MLLLALGLGLFVALHLIPVFAAPWRADTVDRIGKLPYRVVFGLSVIASLALIVAGWGKAEPYFLYDLGMGARHLVYGAVLIAAILLAAAFIPSNIRRLVPNPRMAAIGLWAAAHLLVNGEDRSVLLFGAVLVWCTLAVWGAWRRDGGFCPRADSQPLWRDLLVVSVGAGLYALAMLLHGPVVGVAVAP